MEHYTLTERESTVLYYLTLSLTNKEIADILNVTHHTIKAHISAILHKLGCKNRTDAALYAQKNNLFIHRPSLKRP